MCTIQHLRRVALEQLGRLYEREEALGIYLRLMCEHLSCSATELLVMDKDTPISTIDSERLGRQLERLGRGEPLQYVLGYTEFLGLRLELSPAVLIPRPETEELVHYVLERHHGERGLAVLDVATGSGCIALALAQGLSAPCRVHALELSPEAVAIARRNAERLEPSLQAAVEVVEGDMLRWEGASLSLEGYDIIMSNPPYILPQEAEQMHVNVLEHEPHMALFVPESTPYIYYEALAGIALGLGRRGAHVYAELNAGLAEETLRAMLAILGDRAESWELLPDMSGKQRFAHIRLK